MNKPVSFTLATRLKEKGFDGDSCPIYFQTGRLDKTEDYTFFKNSNRVTAFPAPTIAEVVMWLYEKHGIWININSTDKLQSFWYEIRGIKKIWFTGKNCKSPTEAYESAIKYVLTKLI